jgi:hypothetical protein
MKIVNNKIEIDIDELDAAMINKLINFFQIPTNEISDSYHTFLDLYTHRIELFIALCKQISYQEHLYEIETGLEQNSVVWKSKKHSDGSEWEGWFILGINKLRGEQITYHLPISYWEQCSFEELKTAPDWDGHNSKDVLERLKSL